LKCHIFFENISRKVNRRHKEANQVKAVAQRVADWLAEARAAVIFTGAGVSTESGIPDFRSPGGVWSRRKPVLFDDYVRDPEAQIEYWRQRRETHVDFAAAEPNVAHRTFANWEHSGRIRGVITQNIDGLHQIAGSLNVLELHGTAREVACLECGERYDAESMLRQFEESQTVPRCTQCGGLTKHATISFGQSLSPRILQSAIHWARDADVFLVIGSSLVVTPAAELPALAKESGSRLVIINREPTPLDGIADEVIRGTIGETVQRIHECLPTAKERAPH
jgi:NAD-dependent deacetylase